MFRPIGSGYGYGYGYGDGYGNGDGNGDGYANVSGCGYDTVATNNNRRRA